MRRASARPGPSVTRNDFASCETAGPAEPHHRPCGCAPPRCCGSACAHRVVSGGRCGIPRPGRLYATTAGGASRPSSSAWHGHDRGWPVAGQSRCPRPARLGRPGLGQLTASPDEPGHPRAAGTPVRFLLHAQVPHVPGVRAAAEHAGLLGAEGRSRYRDMDHGSDRLRHSAPLRGAPDSFPPEGRGFLRRLGDQRCLSTTAEREPDGPADRDGQRRRVLGDVYVEIGPRTPTTPARPSRS